MAEVDVKKYKDQSIFDADGDYVPSKERDKYVFYDFSSFCDFFG